MRAFLLLFLLAAPLHADAWKVEPLTLVEHARRQVGVTVSYDPRYVALAYPGGDLPLETGVCCDVLIRALRAQGVDLQKEVHEEMARHFEAFPRLWGLSRPDPNIDHRRVPNLMTLFKRRGMALPLSEKAADYLPGDIGTCLVNGKLPHIFVVSERKDFWGVPLVIHNIGRGAQEEPLLFRYKMTGHYRFR